MADLWSDIGMLSKYPTYSLGYAGNIDPNNWWSSPAPVYEQYGMQQLPQDYAFNSATNQMYYTGANTPVTAPTGSSGFTYDQLLSLNANNPYYTPTAQPGTYAESYDYSRPTQQQMLQALSGMNLGQGILSLDSQMKSTDQNNQWNNYGYYTLDPTGMLQRQDVGTLTANLGSGGGLTGTLNINGTQVAPRLYQSDIATNLNDRWDKYALDYGGNTYNAGGLQYDLGKSGVMDQDWAKIGAGVGMVAGLVGGGLLLAPAAAAEGVGTVAAGTGGLTAGDLITQQGLQSYLASIGYGSGAAGSGLMGTGGTILGEFAPTTVAGMGAAGAGAGGAYFGTLGPEISSEFLTMPTTFPAEGGYYTGMGEGGDVDAGWSTTGYKTDAPWTGIYQTGGGYGVSEALKDINNLRKLYNTGKALLGGGQVAGGAGTAGGYTPTGMTSSFPSPSLSTKTSQAIMPGAASKSTDYITKLAKIESLLNGNNKLPWEYLG